MPVIAISGMPGCGSSTVARKVAEVLGLEFFSMGERFKAHAPGKDTEKAITFLGTEEGSSKEFHTKSDDLMKNVARQGNVVIDGKLAVHFLKREADYRVWLFALIDERANRCAKRDSISPEKAMKQLQKKEKAERELWKKIYGFDYFNSHKEADLVIDTTDKTPEEIVGIIVRSMPK